MSIPTNLNIREVNYNGVNIPLVEPETQTKTVTPTTAGVTVTPDAGKLLSSVTVNGDADLVAGNIKSGVNIFGVDGTLQPAKTEQSKTLTLGAATPATVTPDSGKVLSSVPVSIDTSVIKAENIAKDVTMLGITGTLQPAKTEQSKTLTLGAAAPATVTPDSGKVLSSVPVSIDTSVIKAENIKKDVKVLGTIGTYEGGGGGDLERFISEQPTTAIFPTVSTIRAGAFTDCYSLSTVSFPSCRTIGDEAFVCCYSLSTVSFPACRTIGAYAFLSCFKLRSLYLTGSSYVTLSASNAFNSTPIGGYTASTGGVYGSIYVPASMLNSYKTRTNWSYFSRRFVGV